MVLDNRYGLSLHYIYIIYIYINDVLNLPD